MGMDITFFKANKKEWDKYSKGNSVELRDTMKKNVGCSIPGEADDCPELILIGEFRNCFEMIPQGLGQLNIGVVGRERIEELYDYYKKNEINIANWFLIILNTFTDDDVLLIYYY